MTNIEKAIAKEKEYISYRMKGEEPFHLVDAVRDCGFDSLDDYFRAKKQRVISYLSFGAVEATPFKAIEEVMRVITARKQSVIFVNIDRSVVWPTSSKEYREDYCLLNNIPLLFTNAKIGSTLVSTPGDLGVGICVRKDSGVDVDSIIDGFINIFRKYTDKEIVNMGNDIMYDGMKICGFTSYDTNDMLAVISPMSLSPKKELVTNVCTKKQNKPVGYIDFMTRDNLRKEILEWLQVSSI